MKREVKLIKHIFGIQVSINNLKIQTILQLNYDIIKSFKKLKSNKNKFYFIFSKRTWRLFYHKFYFHQS